MARLLPDANFVPNIHLTPASKGISEVAVPVSKMICYSQETGFTRLRLTGGQTLDVKESTECIDLLVRQATSRT